MRPAVILAILLWLSLAACARLPHLEFEAASMVPAQDGDCNALFVQGEWQFVHVIEAAPPNGQRHSMLGVCRISSNARTIRSALMTLEGLVIFQADYDGSNITVERALPPFDAKGFAEGLMDDLALMFLPPDGSPHRGRERDSSTSVCRWSRPDGSTVDIMRLPDLEWEIRLYDKKSRPTRNIKPLKSSLLNERGPARESIVLESPGLLGYTLTMTLVEAQPLSPAPVLPKASP